MTISLEPTRSSSEAAADDRAASTFAPAPAPVDALLGNYKRAPGHFAEGDGVHLVDSDGKRYLDFVSGIAVNALGYGDLGLRAAMHAAADGLIHVSNLVGRCEHYHSNCLQRGFFPYPSQHIKPVHTRHF